MSSRPPLRLITPGQDALPPHQMSRGHGFDPRRSWALPDVSRAEAVRFWADLVARRCGSREACAVMFQVTFQTACNWFDGFSCPTGDRVMVAVRAWPEEFVVADLRRAA